MPDLEKSSGAFNTKKNRMLYGSYIPDLEDYKRLAESPPTDPYAIHTYRAQKERFVREKVKENLKTGIENPTNNQYVRWKKIPLSKEAKQARSREIRKAFHTEGSDLSTFISFFEDNVREGRIIPHEMPGFNKWARIAGLKETPTLWKWNTYPGGGSMGAPTGVAEYISGTNAIVFNPTRFGGFIEDRITALHELRHIFQEKTGMSSFGFLKRNYGQSTQGLFKGLWKAPGSRKSVVESDDYHSKKAEIDAEEWAQNISDRMRKKEARKNKRAVDEYNAEVAGRNAGSAGRIAEAETQQANFIKIRKAMGNPDWRKSQIIAETPPVPKQEPAPVYPIIEKIPAKKKTKSTRTKKPAEIVTQEVSDAATKAKKKIEKTQATRIKGGKSVTESASDAITKGLEKADWRAFAHVGGVGLAAIGVAESIKERKYGEAVGFAAIGAGIHYASTSGTKRTMSKLLSEAASTLKRMK